ncbi:MAG: RNA polymerase factor sigma-54 [Alphaproteobacteria bacterium]|nr:RNA polymerase factor sigma-54 [Alphaproteobacteria bacterium]
MTISQRIDQRQSQTLVMTPQLQQAIKLLQMSNLELGDFVEQEIEQNPLLERGEGDGSDAPIGDTGPEIVAAAPDADPAPLSGSESETVSGSNDEDVWANDGYNGEERFATTSSGGSFEDDEFSAAQNIAEKPSLRAHLLEQIHVDFTEPADRMVAAALIELLDEAGYLPADLELVRTQLGVTDEHFEEIIARMQRFDPCGIFARSLHECLALQLFEKDRLDPAMGLLLQNLDLLAKRDLNALMRLCNVDNEDLADMIAEIRHLNPKPAMAFTSDVAQPIVPDVILRHLPGKLGEGGGWHVELNTETLPRVLANERYYAQIQSATSKKADKEYIADRWQQANWLVKALHQRATTILKVASEIVRQQDAFFVHGVSHLKPLILKDIATLVEMHESTVSRVTQHKYIATPRGLFELKYFFTTALGRSDGGADMSSESVRARIRAMIDNEKPTSILSDDHLSMMLRGEGIDVARRTVAKYREAMRIPTSAQRRREKRR